MSHTLRACRSLRVFWIWTSMINDHHLRLKCSPKCSEWTPEMMSQSTKSLRWCHWLMSQSLLIPRMMSQSIHWLRASVSSTDVCHTLWELAEVSECFDFWISMIISHSCHMFVVLKSYCNCQLQWHIGLTFSWVSFGLSCQLSLSLESCWPLFLHGSFDLDLIQVKMQAYQKYECQCQCQFLRWCILSEDELNQKLWHWHWHRLTALHGPGFGLHFSRQQFYRFPNKCSIFLLKSPEPLASLAHPLASLVPGPGLWLWWPPQTLTALTGGPGLSTSAVIATHDSDDLTSWLSPHPMSTLCHLCARHFVLPPKNEMQCVCCSKGGRGLTGWTIPSNMCAPEKKLRLVGIACTLHWLWFMIHDCDSEVSPRGFCSHGQNSTLLWPTVTVIHDCDWDVSFGSFVNNISQSCMLAGTSWAHCFRNGCTSMRWRKATMTTPPPWKSVIGWTGQSVRANWRPGCGACGHSHTRHSPESRAVTLASWWSLSLVTVNGLTGPNCQSDPSWHWH